MSSVRIRITGACLLEDSPLPVSFTHQEADDHAADELEKDSSEASNDEGNKRKGGKKDKVVKPVKEKPIKIWIERDIKIGEAVSEQQVWLQEARNTFKKCHNELTKLLEEVKEQNLEEKVKNESKFATTRQQACGLILGLSDWTKTSDNQPKVTATASPAKTGGVYVFRTAVHVPIRPKQ